MVFDDASANEPFRVASKKGDMWTRRFLGKDQVFGYSGSPTMTSTASPPSSLWANQWGYFNERATGRKKTHNFKSCSLLTPLKLTSCEAGAVILAVLRGCCDGRECWLGCWPQQRGSNG